MAVEDDWDWEGMENRTRNVLAELAKEDRADRRSAMLGYMLA